MTDLLRELIDYVVEASPILWSILTKQVYANIVADMLWVVVLGASCVLLVKFTKHGIEKHEEDSYSMWELWAALGGMGALLAGAISMVLLTGLVKMIINPEFYAIRLILAQLSGN